MYHVSEVTLWIGADNPEGSMRGLCDLKFAIDEALTVFIKRSDHNYGSMIYVMILYTREAILKDNHVTWGWKTEMVAVPIVELNVKAASGSLEG